MDNKKNALCVALTVALGATGASIQAAQLYNYALLTINPSVIDSYYGVTGGSWFAMDADENSKIASSEKIPLYPGADGGILIGSTQNPGAIDSWMFGAVPGAHYTAVAPTGGTTNGVDFGGWWLYWNNISIPMGGNAWTPQNCVTLGCNGVNFTDGRAALIWDGFSGSAYSLWYTATVPMDDPSGFGGVRYMLYLEGVVTEYIIIDPVPIPAAVWLFGSGLVGLLGAGLRGRINPGS